MVSMGGPHSGAKGLIASPDGYVFRINVTSRGVYTPPPTVDSRTIGDLRYTTETVDGAIADAAVPSGTEVSVV